MLRRILDRMRAKARQQRCGAVCAQALTPALSQSERESNATTGALPNLHARLRRQVQLSSRLNIESLIPGVEVAHGVGAILIRRMTIRSQQDFEKLRAHLAAPTLRVSDEETLIIRQPICIRRRLV